MIDTISFVNTHWLWQIVVSALLIYVVFVWKEWRQSNTSKLYLKLIVAFLALSSLAIILLKPLVASELKDYKMVLLTKDYHSDQLDSLKKANKKIKVQNYAVNEPIINPNKIPSSMYVLGEGIKPFDFYQLDSLNVKYLGNQTLSGITKLAYKQEQTIGNTIAINGWYAKAKKGHKLLLQDPSKTTLDSVVFASDSSYLFKLSTQLNVKGNFEYHLVEKDSTDKPITTEPLGIRVVPKQALRMLIINGFPTFETKYLKNYLAEKGHELVVRSQVTRGKFKYEYFNLNSKPSVDFSEKSLEQYDLVIMDAQSFRNLSKNQKNNLEAVIRNQGLGLFIQSDSALRSSANYLTSFSFQSDKSTAANLDAWPKVSIPKQPYSFKSLFALQPILQSNNKILTAYKPLGNGRIGTSVFENTYQLILKGNSKVYQTLWYKTINALSKKQVPLVHWETNNAIIFKDEPFSFAIRTNSPNPVVLSQNQQAIPLINDIDIQSLWKGTNYPKNTGWQTQRLKQDTTQVFHYYVADTTHWKSLQSYNTTKANKRQFKAKQTADKPYTTQQPMSLTWLYIIFLLSIGYLWLEPKL